MWDGWRCATNRTGTDDIPAIDNINVVDEQTSEVAVTVAPLLCANSNAHNVETAGMFGRRVRNFDRDCLYRGHGVELTD
jgi:hypothetical protein